MIKYIILIGIIIIAGILLSGCAAGYDDQPNYRLQNAVLRQQNAINSMEIYNRMASPCGINVPCRSNRW